MFSIIFFKYLFDFYNLGDAQFVIKSFQSLSATWKPFTNGKQSVQRLFWDSFWWDTKNPSRKKIVHKVQNKNNGKATITSEFASLEIVWKL